jgi:hypothetical protein
MPILTPRLLNGPWPTIRLPCTHTPEVTEAGVTASNLDTMDLLRHTKPDGIAVDGCYIETLPRLRNADVQPTEMAGLRELHLSIRRVKVRA